MWLESGTFAWVPFEATAAQCRPLVVQVMAGSLPSNVSDVLCKVRCQTKTRDDLRFGLKRVELGDFRVHQLSD